MAEEKYHPAQYNKAWVAAIMGCLVAVEQLTGWSSNFISEAGVTMILGFITPVLVWITPNRRGG